MRSLKDRIAVVAGASRGAGRGIALALGDAGATVYVVGRSSRGGPARPGAPETIEDTAELVTARGGAGIPVRADCTVEADVAAMFDRVTRERGRVDVLANAVWGAADAFSSVEQWMASMQQLFWEQSTVQWPSMMGAGPQAYYLTSVYAARLMARDKGGLIVGVTDGYVEGADPNQNQGQLVWDLAHTTINRLMKGMSVEGKKHKIAVITLMPGFMRTENVLRYLGDDEKLKRMFRFDLSETPEFLGRAVAALAADSKVLKKSGKVCFVADLAKEYGFTDADGRAVPRFAPFA